MPSAELKSLAENESADPLTKQLVKLRTEETDLAECARTVLDALKAKGGDVQTAEQFLNAVVDNTVLVIPNKKAWGDTIVNFTGSDIRRVDLVFGIG